jgi:hypothetical protein
MCTRQCQPQRIASPSPPDTLLSFFGPLPPAFRVCPLLLFLGTACRLVVANNRSICREIQKRFVFLPHPTRPAESSIPRLCAGRQAQTSCATTCFNSPTPQLPPVSNVSPPLPGCRVSATMPRLRTDTARGNTTNSQLRCSAPPGPAALVCRPLSEPRTASLNRPALTRYRIRFASTWVFSTCPS